MPVTLELKATLLAVPPQIVCGEAEPTGVGLTVTVALIAEPVHNGPVTAAVVNTTSSIDIISELIPDGPPLVTK